jgi:alkaline phosphatase D
MSPQTTHDRLLAGLSRRQLLQLAAWMGGGALVQPLVPRRVSGQQLFAEYPFSLGVASGDPLPNGVVLWTRLAPRPLEDGGGMPPAAMELAWEVARDRAFRTIEQKGTTTAYPELAHSVHVEVNGLEPAREYFYRFRIGRETSQVGRTKTAPAAGAAVDRLRFAICGCSNYEDGYFTAYRRLSEGDFDFVLHTGDYIYESRPTNGRLDRKVRQHLGLDAYSITDYRRRYAQYKTDDDLRAAHLSAPFVMSWDDHEVANNYAGDVDVNNTPPELFLLRRAAAFQAYYEHMPLRRAAFPNGSRMQIYRRLQFGSLIDLSVLDTRQYRSDQACGDGVRTDCADAMDVKRTMLGDEQERWLFENLANARSRWTLIGQQVFSFARDLAKATPDGRYSMDKWDGYVGARNRLYARLRETRPPNPVVISGDVHAHFGAELKMDFADSRAETIGVEITNSSISASGDGSDVQADWEATRSDNPHIKYHGNRRGYIACTVTPGQLRAEFRSLERVTEPDAAIKGSAAFVVESGVSRLSPA